MTKAFKPRIFYLVWVILYLCIGYSLAENKLPNTSEHITLATEVVFFEDFEQTLGETLPVGWWVEGGEQVFVEDGHLRVIANPMADHKLKKVCTVWNKQVFSGNLKVEFDAHVLNSRIDANNINFFFLYSDPAGVSLFDTQQFRQSAAYKLYHNLNGYIFTFLNDFRNEQKGDQARMRMRRCPGFKLITEIYGYHCQKNTTYHVTITKIGSQLTFAVDDKIYLKTTDNQVWDKGLIGLRTFQTDLWWDNIKVTQLK